jgi:hypothetical protein
MKPQRRGELPTVRWGSYGDVIWLIRYRWRDVEVAGGGGNPPSCTTRANTSISPDRSIRMRGIDDFHSQVHVCQRQ